MLTILNIIDKLWSKTSLYVLLLIVFIGTLGYIASLRKQIASDKIELDRLNGNLDFYKNSLENSGRENNVLRLTIEELKQDTTILGKGIRDYQKELKIKDRELKNILYIKSQIKTETTSKIDSVEVQSLKNDIALNKILSPNQFTEIAVSVRDSLLKVDLNVEDRLFVYHYQKKLWREPNFWKRLFLFRWDKRVENKYNLKNENQLIHIVETRFITIEE